LPQNIHIQKCVSGLPVLPEWAAGLDVVKPTAFIFHLSRCGSTLVSQLLSLHPATIVLPEVPFLDELLRLHLQWPGCDEATADVWLEAAIKFYGQKKSEAEEHLFIKTDCWHVFFYERLRKLYPDVPIVLLYRSPDEVLRSQQKRRGMQAVPGIIEPVIPGIKPEEIIHSDFDHYFSMVMEKILAKFFYILEKDKHTLLVNYNEGPVSILKKIAAVTALAINNDLLKKMEQRSRYHAKYPEQAFSGDGPPGTIPEYLTPSMHWYHRLEEKRKIIASASVK
jgi:hypothetical protein